MTLGFVNTTYAPGLSGLAYLNHTEPFCPLAPREFSPAIRHPAFWLGQHLAHLPLVTIACKVASYCYSALPSFSMPTAASLYARLPSWSFPGAVASSVGECPAGVAQCVVPPICSLPKGAFQKSCVKGEVTYDSGKNLCEFTTQCAHIEEGLPLAKASIRFSPSELLVLENRNGTLEVSREHTINEELGRLGGAKGEPASLAREAEIIGDLHSGDVITIKKEGTPALISQGDWPEQSSFSAFQRIAQATRGIMGHASSPDQLEPLMKKISAHILKTAGSSKAIDVAFILDTTSSMDPYIENVKQNLVDFLEHLKQKKKETTTTWQVGLVEYRDVGEAFVSRVQTGFTSNLNQIQRNLRDLTTQGGGDSPEAVLDGLMVALDDLLWRPEAQRIVVLIGDAPPHPETRQGARYNEAAVLDKYQDMGTQVVIYPILAGKK